MINNKNTSNEKKMECERVLAQVSVSNNMNNNTNYLEVMVKRGTSVGRY